MAAHERTSLKYFSASEYMRDHRVELERERDEDMVGHRGYTHNFSSCKI